MKSFQDQINEWEKELQENPEIAKLAEETVRNFKQWVKTFPEKALTLKNVIRNLIKSK